MKRLFIIRHAKSSWELPDQDDFDRRLAPRGRRAAPLMGQYMRSLNYRPSVALCSPARRAVETWHYIRDALPCETIEEFLPELYHPDPRAMLDLIREIDNGHPSAILISHNPGVLTLALGLVGRGIKNANPFGKYPTAALTVFDFDVDIWADIRPGAGELVGFTRPKELDSAA
ncbi:MAG: histidine phosphatase family protein [Alphaproteobacteria bacterium]|jgi:phosphohistidine phosphatase|nr:histidine phosphatase family protein [Alphaproteobacteria bacterium]